MREHLLSGDFIYLGCLNDRGQKTSLRRLQQCFSSGYGSVVAIDINPHCFSPPLRVFVESSGRDSLEDAMEALEEHIRDNPTGKIAANVLTWEVEPEKVENWEYGEVYKIGDKFFCAAEDAYTGMGVIHHREAIATCPGGRYERAVRREMKWSKIDTYETGYAVWGTRRDGTFGRIAQFTDPKGDRVMQALETWRLAAVAWGLVGPNEGVLKKGKD